MSALRPAKHGRDHLPDGADPIPAGALQWAHAQESLVSNNTDHGASVGQTYIPWDTIDVARGNTAFDPSDKGTGGYGVKIVEDGSYFAIGIAHTTTGAGVDRYVILEPQTDDPAVPGDGVVVWPLEVSQLGAWAIGNDGDNIPTLGHFSFFIVSGAPFYVRLGIYNNAGTQLYTDTSKMFVWKVG